MKIYNIVLPIGISFFTFQGLTYVIDLYRGIVNVQRNPIKIALYISFFPQLIAGPIVRYKDINEQIENRTSTVDMFYDGLTRFIMGLAKKVIIANEMGRIADMIFANPVGELSPLIAWIGIIAYSFQIYFDFSGYSDMAIGLGKMFGFKFLENFNYPYISQSITEFWRRWHISLSTFFKDYVYIPLGGNKAGNIYFNLLIVFLLTGLWHGAAWTFVFWGLWHGIFLMMEKFIFKKRLNLGIYGRVYTFFIVTIGWVIFRSPDFLYALKYVQMMFGLAETKHLYYYASYYIDNYSIIVFLFAIPLSYGIFNPYGAISRLNNVFVVFLKNIVLLILLTYSIMGIVEASYNPFIYFRF